MFIERMGRRVLFACLTGCFPGLLGLDAGLAYGLPGGGVSPSLILDWRVAKQTYQIYKLSLPNMCFDCRRRFKE